MLISFICDKNRNHAAGWQFNVEENLLGKDFVLCVCGQVYQQRISAHSVLAIWSSFQYGLFSSVIISVPLLQSFFKLKSFNNVFSSDFECFNFGMWPRHRVAVWNQ